MWGLHLPSDPAVAQDLTAHRGPCSSWGWRCQKATPGKLGADAAPSSARGKLGGPIPPGERGASPCPSSRAPGTEQGPNFSLIAAEVLSLGYRMQPGNLSGMPGWKPPSKGNAANPVEERLAPASHSVTSRDSIPTPGSPSGSAGGEPGSQRAREDALRFGETLPCLLSPSGEARQNPGGKQGSEPCSIPLRERSGLSRRAALPRVGWAEPSLPDSPGGREELDRFFWLR